MKLTLTLTILTLTLVRYFYVLSWRKRQRGYYQGHDAIYGGP